MTKPTTEIRYEVIVREHRIDRGKSGDKPSIKSRRFDIYKRVFEKHQSAEVIASVESALNNCSPF